MLQLKRVFQDGIRNSRLNNTPTSYTVQVTDSTKDQVNTVFSQYKLVKKTNFRLSYFLHRPNSSKD